MNLLHYNTYPYEKWNKYSEGSKKQSPICFKEDKIINKRVHIFIFKNYKEYDWAGLTNTGYGITITFPRKTQAVLGGGLDAEYILDHIDLHWLSEHVVNGNRFALEAQLINFHKRWDSIEQAYKTGELAALSTLFTVSPNENSLSFEAIARTVDKVKRNVGKFEKIPLKICAADFLPCDVNRFYRYEGSLTRPPLTEGVTWTVFQTVKPISQSHYDKIRDIFTKYDAPLEYNYRPAQDLCGRKVYSCEGEICNPVNNYNCSCVQSNINTICNFN